MLRTRPAPVQISFVALLSLQARTVSSMGAAFPCLGGNKPPRAPPPMARPLPPHLNACVPDDLNSANDWRRACIPNPRPYLGHPKAPPPHLDRARFDYEVPVKAPPPHLGRLPGIAVRRDLPVIKTPLCERVRWAGVPAQGTGSARDCRAGAAATKKKAFPVVRGS